MHGVGKTTLAKKLSHKLGFEWYSCSSLIKGYVESTDVNKRVKNINKNQSVLIEAYNTLMRKDAIILDGHVTLLDKNGRPTPIDPKVFKSLDVGVFILVVGDVEETLNRLTGRGDLNWNVDYISSLKKHEKNAIKLLSKKLNLDLIEFKVDDDIDLLCHEIKSKFKAST